MPVLATVVSANVTAVATDVPASSMHEIASSTPGTLSIKISSRRVHHTALFA